jgi:hypothetical protein
MAHRVDRVVWLSADVHAARNPHTRLVAARIAIGQFRGVFVTWVAAAALLSAVDMPRRYERPIELNVEPPEVRDRVLTQVIEIVSCLSDSGFDVTRVEVALLDQAVSVGHPSELLYGN